MKKLLLFIMIFSFVCASAQTKLKKFSSLDQLQEAVDLETVDFYEPQYLSGHKGLADGEDTISLPYPTGVKMTVVGGHYWVLQKPGTVFVAKMGEKIPLRRFDCGNKISGFFVFYPEKSGSGLQTGPKKSNNSPTLSLVELRQAVAEEIKKNKKNSNGSRKRPVEQKISSSFPWLETAVIAGLAVIGYALLSGDGDSPQKDIYVPPTPVNPDNWGGDTGGAARILQKSKKIFELKFKF